MVARALDAFRDIAAATPGGEILIVAHAGLMRTLCRALGEHDVRFPNLSGRWFIVHDDGRVAAGEAVQ